MIGPRAIEDILSMLLFAAALASPWPSATPYAVPSLGAGLQWLGAIIASLFPWPAIVLAVVAVLASNSEIRQKVFQYMRAIRLKTLKLGAAEFDLADATDSVKKVFASDVAITLRSYSATLNDVANDQVDNLNLTQLIQAYYDAIKPYFENFPPEQFRLTTHIQDPLYRDYLYQLIDYYPVGGGRGRRLSIRYGIIGRCYRTRASFRIGKLLPEGDQVKGGTQRSVIDAIASRWGVTIEEAIHIKDRPSYVALPLEQDNETFGVLYMDSTVEDAFKPNKHKVDSEGEGASTVNPGIGSDPVEHDMLVTILKRELRETHLLRTILEISSKLREFQPRVDLEQITNPSTNI
jgi:hypothetical protein